MSPLGQKRLECQYKDKLYTLEFQVIEQNACAILGRELCNTLGVIKRTPQKIFWENFRICLQEWVVFWESTTFRQSLRSCQWFMLPEWPWKEDNERELKHMEKMDVIKKQNGPTEWVNRRVKIVKPNKIRICIDPEDLNRAIRRKHYAQNA